MALINGVINGSSYFEKIRNYENIICYGAGSKGAQTVEALKLYDILPSMFVDSDETKWGQNCAGVPIVGYHEMKEKCAEYCILITAVYANAIEIYKSLKQKGETADIYFMSNPYKAENKFLTDKDLDEDKEKLLQSYDSLKDAMSKEIFVQFLNWKITGDASKIHKYTVGGYLEVFSFDLLPDKDNYIFIDVGAYTGDSIIRFLSFCKGKYEHIISYEPDDANYNEALRTIANGRLDNVTIHKIGLWSDKGKKEFFTAGNDNIYESSNFYRGVDNTISKSKYGDFRNSTVQTVFVDTLDNQLENMKIDGKLLIKIDALASEMPILYGAGKIIRKYKPIIAMEYGTYSKYMADTIPYLKSLNKDYKFYIRQIPSFNNNRTFLYCI